MDGEVACALREQGANLGPLATGGVARCLDDYEVGGLGAFLRCQHLEGLSKVVTHRANPEGDGLLVSGELGRDKPVVGCLVSLDDVAEHLASGVSLQLRDGTQSCCLGIKHLISHGLAHVVVHHSASVAHLQSECDVAVTVAHGPCADAIDDERVVALEVISGRHLAWCEVGSLPRQHDDIIIAHTFARCGNRVERHLDGHLCCCLVVAWVGIVAIDDACLKLIIFLIGDSGRDVEDVVHRLACSNCLTVDLVGKQSVLHQTHLIVAHTEAALVADGDDSLGGLAG